MFPLSKLCRRRRYRRYSLLKGNFYGRVYKIESEENRDISIYKSQTRLNELAFKRDCSLFIICLSVGLHMLAHLAELSGILELQLQMPENGLALWSPTASWSFHCSTMRYVLSCSVSLSLIRFISLFRAGCLNKFLRIPEILPLAHGLLSFLHE